VSAAPQTRSTAAQLARNDGDELVLEAVELAQAFERAVQPEAP
jgi:hypothetical protein